MYAQGKRHGYGEYHHSDGTVYKGEWADDREHGQGRNIWPDGVQYEGAFVGGK